jgi:ribosome-binding protein aMBF1 (putative translation factor)
MAAGRPSGDEELVRQFGEVVRNVRLLRGLSQEALAHQAQVHRTFVGRVERGETNATSPRS